MDSKSINKKQCSLNRNSTKFKTPMGSVGPLVASVPVVLSEFETNIFCELKYTCPITLVSSLCTNVHVCCCKILSCNKKISISGYVEKKLRIYLENCLTPKIKTVKIPFKTTVSLKFSNCPRMNTKYESICNPDCDNYLVVAAPLCCKLEYTKFSESKKVVSCKDKCSNKKIHISKMKITLGITILQKQKIFIPDSLGCASITHKCVDCDCDCIDHVEVGVAPNCNLVARICDH